MTIRFVIKKNVEKKQRVTHDSVRVTVYVRLKDGVGIDQMCRTPILVNPLWWDYKRESVNDFAECSDPERSAINGEIQELRRQLASKYVVAKIKGPVGTDWLHKTIEEYQSDIDGGHKLLPFISPQKYNMAIKHVLEKSGITRMVTVLDPLTRMDKKVRICDIGSSHMARRTFAGNIYKKVKDPALVASLTGHTEGSKAFARYRDIDDEMKRELVELLE